MKDEHIIEAAGRTRVVIRDGVVVSVGKPMIQSCPLAKRFSVPVDPITPEQVQKNIEGRIASFGMCTPERSVECSDDFVLFGASELLMQGLRSGSIDAVILACDGAGTVIAPTPELVQGIGGKMSGLVKTTPIPAVIERIEAAGGIVVDSIHASMDQIRGVQETYKAGYSHPAVTTASAAEAAELRSRYPDILLVGVHTTGLSFSDSEILIDTCDLLYPCASQNLWDLAKEKALLQGGAAVPVFALTQIGKELVLEKMRCSDTPLFVKNQALPVVGTKRPEPLC